MLRIIQITVAGAAALSIATPAIAASSDYLLIIDGVNGRTSSAAKVASWSFGQSRPSTGNLGQGRVVAPREAGSGMASGKLRESPSKASLGKVGEDCDDAACKPVAGDLDGDGALDFAEAGKLDQVGALRLTLASRSDIGGQLCGTTDHLRSGHIVKSDGTVYDLSDIRAVCTGDDGSGVTVSLTGNMRQRELTGHVTLIK